MHITFEKRALKQIARLAYEANMRMENIGARRLHTVMGRLLSEYLFDIPDRIPCGSRLVIDEKYVKRTLSSLIEDEEAAKYIL